MGEQGEHITRFTVLCGSSLSIASHVCVLPTMTQQHVSIFNKGRRKRSDEETILISGISVFLVSSFTMGNRSCVVTRAFVCGCTCPAISTWVGVVLRALNCYDSYVPMISLAFYCSVQHIVYRSRIVTN